MKRFKIGFLAVVAILAMSFTVASQKDFLKKAKFDSGTCNQNVDLSAATYFTDGSCSGTTAAVTASTVPTKFLDTKTSQTASTFTCNGGNVFCCAEYTASITCSDGITQKDRLDKVITKP